MAVRVKSVQTVNKIESRIFTIRGLQVMLDRDLAELYGVETRAINQAVRRNIERFPLSFMFQLDNFEFDNWKSQIVMSNEDKIGLRRPPYAFTEQGVAMLSAVLHSSTAVAVSIKIMEAKNFNLSHDRFLIIDGKEIYHLGASLKDLGKKWFAFSKMEGLALLEKVNVYF